MRIAIDCHNVEGQRTGVGRYLWNLLKEWQSQKFVYNVHDREHCIQFFLYFKNEIPKDVRELLSGSKPSPPPTEGGRRACWNWRILSSKSNALFKHWLLPRAAARDKVDVLFCPDYVLPLPLTFFRHNLGGIKTAVAIHDIIYEARPQDYSWPSWRDKILLKWASKQSVKAADVIFAPSEFTKSEILKYYSVSPEKIVVTPLAPDYIFSPLPAIGGEGAKNIWGGIGKKYHITRKKYVFFVGSIFNRRFLPQKIQGFTQFSESHPDFQFLIIGKNHTKPYQDIGMLMKSANQELGREAIIWRKFASDEELMYLYNGAFATLWLSSYEGFGLPILESMACGTPVITCRAGSLPEVAGDAAVYIRNPANPAQITTALVRLSDSHSFYRIVTGKGFVQTQKFSWQRCATYTIDNILRLCKDNRRTKSYINTSRLYKNEANTKGGLERWVLWSTD